MVFSQNFIKSPILVRQLLSISSLNKNDLVVEIGPGKGIITQELINNCSQIVAIEKDINLIGDLKSRFYQTSNLQIINHDFLTWPLPNSPFKIFSNIPFNITAEIIDKILKSNHKPEEIYFITQLEAAEKYILTDNLNTQNSILLSVFYEAEILGDIDRSAFTPKPQVDIAFIKFTLKPKSLIDPKIYSQFRDFVIFGFNQWKPNIFEVYKKIFSYDQFKKINHQLKVNNLKPSQLSLDQWLKLFDIYTKFVSEIKKNQIIGFEKKYLNNIRAKKY